MCTYMYRYLHYSSVRHNVCICAPAMYALYSNDESDYEILKRSKSRLISNY